MRVYSIEETEDVDEIREWHTLAFPGSPWIGDDQDAYWLARSGGRVIGFCSAMHLPKSRAVFLSRAAVIRSAGSGGLHRRMIAERLTWGVNGGARIAVTYTSAYNYASLTNLLYCGFRGATRSREVGLWDGFHVLYLNLAGNKRKAPSGAFWDRVLPLIQR